MVQTVVPMISKRALLQWHQSFVLQSVQENLAVFFGKNDTRLPIVAVGSTNSKRFQIFRCAPSRILLLLLLCVLFLQQLLFLIHWRRVNIGTKLCCQRFPWFIFLYTCNDLISFSGASCLDLVEIIDNGIIFLSIR